MAIESKEFPPYAVMPGDTKYIMKRLYVNERDGAPVVAVKISDIGEHKYLICKHTDEGLISFGKLITLDDVKTMIKLNPMLN